jgi:hypothetical protein
MLLLPYCYRMILHIPQNEAVTSPNGGVLEEGVQPPPGVSPESHRRRRCVESRLIHSRVGHSGSHSSAGRTGRPEVPHLRFSLFLSGGEGAQIFAAGG